MAAHERSPDPARFSLVDAQRVLARAYGFASWTKLAAEVHRATTSRFFRAAEQGDLPALRTLVAMRADLVQLERAENDEHTALHYAVLNRDLACTRYLLEAGADPHKRGSIPTARAPAAQAAAQALIDAGAEQTPRGAAALGDLAFLRPMPKERLQQATGSSGGLLTLAVTCGQPAVLDLLLAKGLDPDERIDLANVDDPVQSWGMPLWHAAAYGEYAMAEVLLDAGADVNAMVYASGGPMERAYGAGDERMKALLRRRGAVVPVETIGLYRDVRAARDVIEGRVPAVTDRRHVTITLRRRVRRGANK